MSRLRFAVGLLGRNEGFEDLPFFLQYPQQKISIKRRLKLPDAGEITGSRITIRLKHELFIYKLSNCAFGRRILSESTPDSNWGNLVCSPRNRGKIQSQFSIQHSLSPILSLSLD